MMQYYLPTCVNLSKNYLNMFLRDRI